MTKEECIGRGKELVERAKWDRNAEVAFRASYYFFWGQDFESAKKALGIAYGLKDEAYLPSDHGSMSGLMEPRVHSALVRAFQQEGMEGVLRESRGNERAVKLYSVLRQGGLWDEARQLAFEYIEFNAIVFLRAYLLSISG